MHAFRNCQLSERGREFYNQLQIEMIAREKLGKNLGMSIGPSDGEHEACGQVCKLNHRLDCW